MFDAPYIFRYILFRNALPNEYFIREHKLTFSCKHNHQYIVNVEEYEFDIYIIKFHLKSHSDSSKKYNLLTNLNDASRVIATCVEIILYFFNKNEKASFGFVGANMLEEEMGDTKRFRVYKRVMENLFSPVYFYHYHYPNKSAYILLNKSNPEDNLLEKINKMFDEHYLF